MTADSGIPDGPIAAPPCGFAPDGAQEAILRDALHAAGVQLGAYDERILTWLAHWDWSTVAVITSWINRARQEN